MGDSRYDAYYSRVADGPDRPAQIRALPDEGVIAALAAAALHGDRYVTNVLTTEAMNRLQRPRMRRHFPTHSARDDGRRLSSDVANVSPGEHLCLIHETHEEQLLAAVAYLRAGLARGERCIYVTHENDRDTIENALRSQGTEPAPFLASGALLILTQQEASLKNGRFDPDWMIQFLGNSLQEAEDAGYAGLRVTGEMTWALGEDTDGGRLLEYESKLNRFFPGRNVSAICQYDRRRFDAQTLMGVVHTHPKVIHGGALCENFHYTPPEELLEDAHASPEATLSRLLDTIRGRAEAEAEVLRLNQDLEHLVHERTRELQEAVRELESFSYTVSHDLRAPLRGIDFYAQALEDDYGARLDEEGLTLLTRLRSESQRLSSLVSHLLTLGGVTRAELRPTQLDLSQIAREVVETLRASEPSRQVDVHVEEGLACIGDPHLVRMLLQNLLTNAWKFTRRTSAPRIRFTSRVVDEEQVFEVTDNGAGFDPAGASKLFTAFGRLHSPQEFEGSGIGLATVARVVRRHAGRVWAEGKVGQGATFWFTLPEGRPQPPAFRAPEPESAGRGEGVPASTTARVRVRGQG